MGGDGERLAGIRDARAARDAAHEELYAAALRRLRLVRAGARADGGERQLVERELAERRTAARAADAGVARAIAELLGDRSPRDLLASWEDDLPILLLPVRVETRWRVPQRELWVRVFPDDVAVVTHEKVLTDAEVVHGRAYWTARHAGAEGAWTALADRLGANRAAWVARQTQPANWAAAEGDAHAVLQFADPPLTKPDRWTAAPHTRVLPDRFVLMGWRGSDLVVEHVGASVADVVVVGPAPLDHGDGPSIGRDQADKTLALSEDYAWVRDFDAAVSAGLAFRVRLSAQDVERGFDQLVVIGLKHAAGPDDAKALVEDLLDNHHYSLAGLSLVAQGTPTNNTGGNDTPYSRSGRGAAESGPAETGPPLFAPAADRTAATDGQRLADYLGIGYEPLLHADGADLADHAEAVAMNRALYAGTLGYYLDHMLNGVLDDDAELAVRRHFVDHVSGRGPLPAIRVGNQPYGILPTSSFGRWAVAPMQRRGKVAGLSFGDRFERRLHDILARLDEAWASLAPGLVRIGAPGDAAAHLLDVLGLAPTSVEYFQRVGYSWDYLRNLDDFAWGGKYFGDLLKKAIEDQAARGLLTDLGYHPTDEDGHPKPLPLLLQLIWRHYHTKLDAKQLIDGQPLSETSSIAPYEAGRNYVDWLRANADNTDALEREDFGGAAAPNALLYSMLRFSLLREAERALFRWLTIRGIDSDVLRRSRKFMNVGPEPSPSTWEVFRAPADALVAQAGTSMPLLKVIQLPQFAEDEGQFVHEQHAALDVLRGMPTARLERVLAEHLDTLSYRLDAWQTSLFARRLHRQRRLDQPPNQRRTGLYLGAYGFLENLRATPERRAEAPARLHPRGDDGQLYVQTGTGGHVHAPSLNHATAAALLRNGYLTHATPQHPDMLSVNLSSERVRRARYLLDGIRGGQSLEVLLGAQFERGLHDWTTRPVDPVILDQLKPAFREAFPIKRTKIPQAADAAGRAATVTEDHQVINGLDLATTTQPYPYGIAALGSLSAEQRAAIEHEREGIADTLDAMRDVLTAEAAYQLALGNFDHAAAIVQSTRDGNVPPDVEILRTPRGTGLAFTQRLAVSLDPAQTANPWPGIPLTPRAKLEPALNDWVGTLLGDPATVGCRVTIDGAPTHGTVTLADLRLQPLDFVYVVRREVEESGLAELEARVRQRFATTHTLADETVVKVAFADPGAAERPFVEALALGDRIRQLLGTSRPLSARHFHSPSKDGAKAGDDVDRIDLAELRTRVRGWLTDVRALVAPLQAALAADDPTALRTSLQALADAGFAYALPHSAVGGGPVQLEALTAQARAIVARVAADLGPATDALLARADDATATTERRVAALTAAVRGWVGDDFVLLPRFALADPADVAAAHAARAQLLAYAKTVGIALPVREWLHGAACVRPLVHNFELLRAIAETVSNADLALEPLQLPHRDGDSWLGVQFPPGTDVAHDTISLVQHLPDGFDAAKPQSGLMVDEWVEVVPRREEVTGVTFNFDAPNSAPPQALLLAISPQHTGSWRFDDLVDIVLDTFRRARLRAVEPDKLGDLPAIGTLLPAVMAEFSTGQSTISLDYALVLLQVRDQLDALRAHRAPVG
jgi:hypothetical protein